jgi:hypothetical protein
MAPELCGDSDTPPQPKVNADVFSFGYLIFFAATSKKPLEQYHNSEIWSRRVRGKRLVLQWPLTKTPRTDLRQLVAAATNVDPDARPSMAQVLDEQRRCWPESDELRSIGSPAASTISPTVGRTSTEGVPDFWTDLRGFREVLRVNEQQRRSDSTKSKATARTSVSPQLRFAGLQATDVEQLKLSVFLALMDTNFPVPVGSCCILHAGTDFLQQVCGQLLARPCDTHDLHEQLDAENAALVLRCANCMYVTRMDEIEDVVEEIDCIRCGHANRPAVGGRLVPQHLQGERANVQGNWETPGSEMMQQSGDELPLQQATDLIVQL